MDIFEPKSGQNLPPGVMDIPDTSGACQRCCDWCENVFPTEMKYGYCLYDIEEVVERCREDADLPVDIAARRLMADLKDREFYIRSSDRASKCERYVEY